MDRLTTLPFQLDDVTRELCRRSLRKFVEAAWGTVEPHEFVPGWHIDCICDHLQAVSRGEIQNLIINIPPRHGKSLIVSVFWPAWEWGPNGRPEIRWLTSSYAASLSIRDSVKCRRVIQSPWYQRLWGDRFRLVGDQNAKARYENDKRGYRLASSVGGATTGEGGDRIVVDDPNNVNEVESDAIRESTNTWWDEVMSTRANNLAQSTKVIIQQRSHDNDLTGHILKTAAEDWKFLVLPAEYESKAIIQTNTGFKDPRRREGELLWPQRFDKRVLGALKRSLGGFASASQLQQRPVPRGGGIIKRHWWRFYDEIPEDLDVMFQSWDMSFKDTGSSDYVAGQVWGIKGANRYLLDEVHDRLSFTNTVRAVVRMSERWPNATAKYIEDAANGPAVMDALKDRISGIIAVRAKGSKESRAFAVSPEIEAGNVYLPNPKHCRWVEDFIDELAAFPRGAHDDRVDSCTQALLQARNWVNRYDIPPISGDTRMSPVAGLSAY